METSIRVVSPQSQEDDSPWIQRGLMLTKASSCSLGSNKTPHLGPSLWVDDFLLLSFDRVSAVQDKIMKIQDQQSWRTICLCGLYTRDAIAGTILPIPGSLDHSQA
jgi:hypothetical protein